MSMNRLKYVRNINLYVHTHSISTRYYIYTDERRRMWIDQLLLLLRYASFFIHNIQKLRWKINKSKEKTKMMKKKKMK